MQDQIVFVFASASHLSRSLSGHVTNPFRLFTHNMQTGACHVSHHAHCSSRSPNLVATHKCKVPAWIYKASAAYNTACSMMNSSLLARSLKLGL